MVFKSFQKNNLLKLFISYSMYRALVVHTKNRGRYNMKLTVLVDNNTLIYRYFVGEPALSFFIEVGGENILFDTVYSDAFLKNAERMGINLRELDVVVLSHGHVDHTWGLTHLIRLYMEAKIEQLKYRTPVIIGHPLVFNTKLFNPIGEIGSILSHEKLNYHFPIQLTKEPLWITDQLVFLGEIKRTFDFEGQERSRSRVTTFIYIKKESIGKGFNLII